MAYREPTEHPGSRPTEGNGSAGRGVAAGHGTAPSPAAEAVAIGRVVSVRGSRVVAVAAGQAAGTAPQDLQLSALVKMHTPESVIFGMVSGLDSREPGPGEGRAETYAVQIDLVGETVTDAGGRTQAFQRGVSYSPRLGDTVYAATAEDLRQVYARPTTPCARVGHIYQDRSLPAYIVVDELLGKHFAVLGTTGSGKSCAVSQILRAILAQHGMGHVVLLDLHNEYGAGFRDCAEVLGTGELELPHWILNFEELQEILIGHNEDREAAAAILSEGVMDARRTYLGEDAAHRRFTVDTPIPYRMADVLRRIDISLGKLNKPTDSAPYIRLKDRISTLQNDRRYAFMFEEGLKVRDNMSQILSRVFRVPVDGKPLTILDLSDVPSEIMNVVIALICRLTFDFALWTDRDMPVMLVCEEAHRYAADGDDSFAMTRRALSQIANEGRKYGVSLCLVSQRPSELSVGILSQCNTIFAMRMSNQKDQDFVETRLSESAMGLLDSLPSLRTGEAIGVGEGVSVPVRLYFDLLPAEQLPRSGTASFSSAWRGEGRDEAYIEDIVERWRNQHR